MHIATLRDAEGGTCLAWRLPDGSFRTVPDALAALGPVGGDGELLRPEGNRWLTPEGLKALALLAEAAARSGLAPADLRRWRLAPPVPNPGKIIAVGRNYLDHVREGQEIWAKRGKLVEVPTFPSAFAKFPSSLAADGDPILIPKGREDVDYEVELAVVIGSPAIDVDERDALGCVAGYTICNDVAVRGIQRQEMEAQIGITLAKNFPNFAPMGPWLVTADEIADPQRLAVKLEVDGDVRQNASTADMIFPVAQLIAYWSRVGLFPGDIIITGTPSGVALARPEPEKFYLRPGQSVVASVEGIGALTNPVVAQPG